MGHTGHIYNFDYNMNTYFPNSILAKGGVTAYQSSDVRLKTNITKLNCLKVIKSIGGTYEFDYIRDHKHSIGFIAQNINNPLETVLEFYKNYNLEYYEIIVEGIKNNKILIDKNNTKLEL